MRVEELAWLKKRDAIRNPQQKLKFTSARVNEVDDLFKQRLFWAKARADGAKEGALRHRFGQVIISTEAHCSTNVVLLALSRKKDQRNGLCLWRATECSHDAESIELRHNYLRKNEVRFFLLSQRDTNPAVLGEKRLKLLQLQDRCEVATHLWLALDY
jgi:hypothetical protein